jgi:hypothetical protein
MQLIRYTIYIIAMKEIRKGIQSLKRTRRGYTLDELFAD